MTFFSFKKWFLSFCLKVRVRQLPTLMRDRISHERFLNLSWEIFHTPIKAPLFLNILSLIYIITSYASTIIPTQWAHSTRRLIARPQPKRVGIILVLPSLRPTTSILLRHNFNKYSNINWTNFIDSSKKWRASRKRLLVVFMNDCVSRRCPSLAPILIS